MTGDTYPACHQCATGHHRTCDGFRDDLGTGASGHPCGCYIAEPAELHPNTYRGKQAAKTVRCRENGTHYPQSIGFGSHHCGTCGWVGPL